MSLLVPVLWTALLTVLVLMLVQGGHPPSRQSDGRCCSLGPPAAQRAAHQDSPRRLAGQGPRAACPSRWVGRMVAEW